MHKKGSEMGLNTIVMAIIALIVLIVVIIIFANKMGLFSKETNNCKNTGKGICMADPNGDACNSQYHGRLLSFQCPEKSDKCCVSACSIAGGECAATKCSEDKLINAFCSTGYCCVP
jgi:hypothetical protein